MEENPSSFSILYPERKHKFVEKKKDMKFFSCCVIRNSEGKYLLVEEAKKARRPNVWYFAGGKVDKGETFSDGAVRESQEEGGIKISLEAFLRIEHNASWGELRVQWFASSDDPGKNIPDKESEGSLWESFENINPQKYLPRDKDWIPAIHAVHNGVPKYPIDVLKEENPRCWSTEYTPEPYFLTLILIVLNQQRSSFLVRNIEEESVIPCTDCVNPLCDGIQELVKLVEKESNLSINLEGIHQIQHIPLPKQGSTGRFQVYYVASQSEGSSLSSLSGFEWKEYSEGISLPYGTSTLDEFFKKHKARACMPLTAIVPSIYSKW